MCDLFLIHITFFFEQHAWGGPAFVWGGEVDGGKIMGQYPVSFDNTDVSQIGRGILIPYRSWESMWYGVTNWMGVTDEDDMRYVLPNNGNMGCDLYTDADMYTVGNTTIGGCGDRTVGLRLSMFITEPRYLTGLEQKRICNAAISLTSSNANTQSRCTIVDQQIIVSFGDGRRRVLSAEEIASGRRLQEVTFELTAETDTSYDTQNGTNTEGTEYLESGTDIAEDMNDAIVNGAGCTAEESRRLLRSNRGLQSAGTCFQIGNIANITECEALVSSAPSNMPSRSSSPSDNPSNTPSESPSLVPSVSSEPTMEDPPSFLPSISIAPSMAPTPLSSASPSVAPSGRPSRDCPNPIETCGLGGYFSVYSCACLCVSPYCPDSANEDPLQKKCSSSVTCPADYHAAFLDDEPAPWFSFGSSCTSSKELPSSVTAIYKSKEDCCDSERPGDSGCVTRPAEIYQLSYHGELTLGGYDCSSSTENSIAPLAGNFATAILADICENSGVTCGDDDKVVVTTLCGYELNTEATYSSTTRRRRLSTDNTIEFTFNSLDLEESVLGGIESILRSFFSGTSLDDFLSNVLADGKFIPYDYSLLSCVYFECTNTSSLALFPHSQS